MTRQISVWQSDRPLLSMVRVLVLLLLSPLLVLGALLGGLASVVSSLFPPRLSSAQDLAEGLNDLLTFDDEWDLDDAIGDIVGRRFSDPRLETFRLRIQRMDDPPWSQATIDELKAMRDSARTIAAGGST